LALQVASVHIPASGVELWLVVDDVATVVVVVGVVVDPGSVVVVVLVELDALELGAAFPEGTHVSCSTA
jgi:hypothetical protein